MDFFAVISLLGGLGLFLYGMEVMSGGLKNSSGEALKRVLGKLTQNAFMGVLVGTLVTAVIQSSTATIVLTVGLMTAGVLNLKQSVSIVLGANIGTTVTAQIIRLMDIESGGNVILELFKPSTLAPIALIIGIILLMFLKRTRGSQPAGNICMGFGILFTGLVGMTSAVAPLSGSEAFANILSRFSDMPMLGIFTGLGLTVIVQSSSAMVGIVQTLSSTGIMTFNVVYPLIMGINLGTCVTTAIVCSIGSSRDAKRTGIVHIIFNCIGTLLFMLAMTILHKAGAFPGLWEKVVNSGGIANFQTLFNLITAAVLLPFTNLLVKASMVIIKPDKSEMPASEVYPRLFALDERLFISPTLALDRATDAVAAMGDLAIQNLVNSITLLDNYDESVRAGVLSKEDVLDNFADTSDTFLVGLSQQPLSDRDSRAINLLMQATGCFERIGDYATNIGELAQRLRDDSLLFSDNARNELDTLTSAVIEIGQLTIAAFENRDDTLTRKIEPLEEVIDDIVALLRDRHIERLKGGVCTISAGLVFLETLTYLERVADQCSGIAVLILAQDNVEILKAHHEYIRTLHEGGDVDYSSEFETQRRKYLGTIERE